MEIKEIEAALRSTELPVRLTADIVARLTRERILNKAGDLHDEVSRKAIARLYTLRNLNLADQEIISRIGRFYTTALEERRERKFKVSYAERTGRLESNPDGTLKR